MTETKKTIPSMPVPSNLRKFESPKRGAPLPPRNLFESTAMQPDLNQPDPEQFRQIAVGELKPYEHNPRTLPNAMREDMKETFRTSGIDGVVLIVTRRPGESIWLCARGGNTRLQVIQELYAETNDPRFQAIRCVIKPWPGDARIRAWSIGENLIRSDLCFWETAAAVVDLKAEVEKEFGGLSQRDFIEHTKTLELTLSRTSLVYYVFAVEYFDPYNFAIYLTRNHIERLKPLYTALERLCKLKHLELKTVLADLFAALEVDWVQSEPNIDQLIERSKIVAGSVLELTPVELDHAMVLADDLQIKDWETMARRAQHKPISAGRPKGSSNRNYKHPTPTVSTLTNVSAAPAPEVHTADTNIDMIGMPIVRLEDCNAAIERCYQLAIDLADHTDGLGSLIRRCDLGVGWFIEPWVEPALLKEVVHPAFHTNADLWSVLAMLSGQWQQEVWEKLPADSIWVSVMQKRAPKDAATCVARVRDAQLAWPAWVFGRCEFGDFSERTARSQGALMLHDYVPLLVTACIDVMRMMPRRFAHIRVPGTTHPKIFMPGVL